MNNIDYLISKDLNDFGKDQIVMSMGLGQDISKRQVLWFRKGQLLNQLHGWMVLTQPQNSFNFCISHLKIKVLCKKTRFGHGLLFSYVCKYKENQQVTEFGIWTSTMPFYYV